MVTADPVILTRLSHSLHLVLTSFSPASDHLIYFIISPCLLERGEQLICAAGVMMDGAER
ncbi:hypothetical protein EYF80_014184 [Liparis tanakae]|uniref:Uncharacterized protein n=1 Tax=Liparis tanakae TaxID=230148 RepID=A0A4Z2IDZ4_9TELE|nr:hypothetical protein EYF80_014184 [Liparis tanakae]